MFTLPSKLDSPISSGAYSSKRFTWSNALWLPRWKEHAKPSRSQAARIIDLSAALDHLLDALNLKVVVTSWLRPVTMRGDYNALIGGAKLSEHRTGAAVDLVPESKDVTVDSVMQRIKNEALLERFGLRTERNGESLGRPWLHFDRHPAPEGFERIFNP